MFKQNQSECWTKGIIVMLKHYNWKIRCYELTNLLKYNNKNSSSATKFVWNVASKNQSLIKSYKKQIEAEKQ